MFSVPLGFANFGFESTHSSMTKKKFLSLIPLCLFASVLNSSAQAPKKETFTPPADKAGQWQFVEDPKLPNVLIIGDSISIGYTRDVRRELAGVANVFRPMMANGKGPANCGDTEMGLAGIDAWLEGKKWSVIHFNWGLWDLCYRVPGKAKSGNRDKVNGKISIPIPEYKANLEKLVTKLQATGAKLIWAPTTYVPEGESGRVRGDDERFNVAAAEIMTKHGIAINDLHKTTSEWQGKYSTRAGDVHYTAEGSKLLGKQAADAIRPLLK